MAMVWSLYSLNVLQYSQYAKTFSESVVYLMISHLKIKLTSKLIF